MEGAVTAEELCATFERSEAKWVLIWHSQGAKKNWRPLSSNSTGFGFNLAYDRLVLNGLLFMGRLKNEETPYYPPPTNAALPMPPTTNTNTSTNHQLPTTRHRHRHTATATSDCCQLLLLQEGVATEPDTPVFCLPDRVGDQQRVTER
jgi:hypothetical protein